MAAAEPLATVTVKNIAPATTDSEVRDFFSFCGKIAAWQVEEDGATKSATVTFEKPAAAKTALLLDNTQLGPNVVSVTGDKSLEEFRGGDTSATGTTSEKSDGSQFDHTNVSQEDKPRSRIIAEYLAHGYVISDKAIEKAIDVDKTHGISSRFMNALTQFDDKYKATDKAKELDQRHGISNTAQDGWNTLYSYFEKALGTPSGQKLVQFYESTNKQVMDVHTEARRLADLKNPQKGAAEGASTTAAGTAPAPEAGGVSAEKANPPA